ncbi:hypothetical protein BD309DRAFT_877385 [Dichomitus squalens]|uniref:Uncharacterized protein n=1 Tax=Dichomitus squalens TaxID=114155 RepID=A0A4Q9N9P4_9APHY|nr:hypothetical protein BD309DRAFT_877385 [Dichomitus squalens]TBU52383.1 hypothetical protein BD310DRAFT_832282 [Dichomitus squalens]
MPNRKISIDIKERSLGLAAAGWEGPEIAYALAVSERSVKRWALRASQHGDLRNRTALRGRRRILNHAELAGVLDLIRASPSLYLDEIVAEVAVRYHKKISISALHRTLVAAGITYKKLRKTAIERDEVARAQWKANIFSHFRAEQLVFADESSKNNQTASRTYGRALSGQQFYDWIVSDLLPKMNPYPGPNSVLIIDNCNTHKSVSVHLAIEAAGMCFIEKFLHSTDNLYTLRDRLPTYFPSAVLSRFESYRGGL